MDDNIDSITITRGETNAPRRGARIQFLDGLRCVAIMAVILFHYLSRYAPPQFPDALYPYGTVAASFFQYGYYGVRLFFVISGFVITLTLYRCSTPWDFFARRFSRLWPTMALCSTFTFILLRLIPGHLFVRQSYALIPSLTFVDPSILNWLCHTTVFQWVDGSYWSLFIEVQFYGIAALLFFAQRDHFPEHVAWFGGVVAGISFTGTLLHLRWLSKGASLVLIADYFPWFMLGIAFYLFHEKRSRFIASVLFVLALSVLLSNALMSRSGIEASMDIAIPALFFIAMLPTPLNRVLSSKAATAVGLASYSLYLLHEYLGVALIRWTAKLIGVAGPSSILIAAAVCLLMIVLSYLIFNYYERPVNRRLVIALTSLASEVDPVVAPDHALRRAG